MIGGEGRRVDGETAAASGHRVALETGFPKAADAGKAS